MYSHALEHYSKTFIDKLLNFPLQKERPRLNDLRMFLEQFVDTTDLNFPKGCMICNAMIETMGMNDRVDAVIQRYGNVYVDTFESVLHNSNPNVQRETLRKKAEFLYGSFLGLIVLKRMGIQGTLIQNVVAEMMNSTSIAGE